MNQQIEKFQLKNWELVSINPNKRNWHRSDYFSYWAVTIQSIIGFSLIASLYLLYDLNSIIVLSGCLIAVLLVFIFTTIVGTISQTSGLPFPVILRLSMGFNGARYIGMIRGLVASKTAETIALIGAGEEDWPPCMRKAIGELSQGVNVNHFGRVFLASISRCIGIPQESTVDFFRNAPDFSESTTSYQVGHVYEREYVPSGCSKLKINHNCAVQTGDDRLCDQPWMDHPLKYIRAKQRRRKLQGSVESTQSSDNSGDA